MARSSGIGDRNGSDLQSLDAASLAFDSEYDALCLAVAITPSQSLSAALAKVSVLPDEETLAKNIKALFRCYAEGQKAE